MSDADSSIHVKFETIWRRQYGGQLFQSISVKNHQAHIWDNQLELFSFRINGFWLSRKRKKEVKGKVTKTQVQFAHHLHLQKYNRGKENIADNMGNLYK